MNLYLILAMAFVAVASPGPGVLAIVRASMARGRAHGLAMASGMTTGSFTWGTSAALGIGGLLMSHPVFLDILRYAGGGYLLFLAWKSARSALRRGGPSFPEGSLPPRPLRISYVTGLGLYLTNPKAIFFYAALYGIGMPADVTAVDLALAVVAVSLQTGVILHCYALGFSLPVVRRGYLRIARWIDGTVSVLFAGAAVRVLAP